MRRLVIPIMVLLAVLSDRVWSGQRRGTDTAQAQATGSLPGSLDNLYPPKAPGPTWFLTMLGLGTSFSGVVSDFMEGDFANAETGYADFRVHYGKLSQMVPEWAGDWPTAPMDALGAALKSRDPAKFMPAVESASAVCHSCHVKNMTSVQQKYHWDDFGVITLTDPVSKAGVPFRAFMQMLEGDLSGVQVDLAQGQVSQAHQHALGLAARYGALREACAACHDSERHYFVDPSITGMIDKLGTALGSAAVDRASVQELAQGIGMESCHKCHLVHGPAALSRYTGTPAK